MRRSIYLAVFVVLSGLAGFFYYAHTRQAAALMATHDLSVGTRIQDGDVTVRLVNPSSLSYAVLTAPDQAIGQIVSFPVLEGQFIDSREVAPSRNASLLGAGLNIPAGYRIIGLPVAPAAAVGGVLKAGDRVDVMAIPNPSKTTITVDPVPAAPVTIGADVLVLGLRTDQGSPVDQTDHTISASGDKPASVLLAIPQTDEATYSAAIASSTFFLALSTD
jgi:Flp pilus assembly protein CpaB